ncbi:MAG TPA: ABC-F family ATP-binding cassette domain-containing protein [Terriglobales bacterium]|jgi:ATP-binding cassette subfamily F protein 3|nr:ABC-F family ATP-binding cassette domain-containing protein [Terriglobales bacterium]
MIQLSSAGKRYGHKLLFEDADWLITPESHVGLVGANGTGKSTVMKILAGLESLDYGSISRAKGISTGYLPQDGLTMTGRTVFAECMSVFDELHAMEKEMEALTRSMSELDHQSQEYSNVADRYQKLEHEFVARDGYTLEAHVGQVLTGLGFGRNDWARQTEEFSGGWQMRLALAKLLLQKPNLLLLDEPTNHLDLEARNWLEEYLTTYPYAFVLISHDRYFLDVTVDRIVEIWNKQIHFYAGNYDQYLAAKSARKEQLESAYKTQRDRIEQLEVFINRFRYTATKAKQVQSRIKELEKIERIEIPEEEKTVHFSFPQPKSSGRIVAEFSNVAKSYGESGISEHRVFQNVNFMIERGERIALVGVNGAGKSTLIKLLAGQEPLTAGEYKLGHNVEADYFAQDQYKELDPEARILDDLGELAPASTQTQLRSLLGCFLFSGDDVFKRIGVLSGGERNRYALLKMLLHPANFLLLDEPTNHLDLRAKDVLLEALMKYTGTVVFVSHDRYFIDGLATRVFEIGAGKVEIYPGNYEDYLWRKQQPVASSQSPVSSQIPVLGSQSQSHGHNGDEAAAVSLAAELKGKRLNPIKRQQMADRLHEVEEEIARAETAIAVCETQLQSFVSADETQRQSQELAVQKKLLQGLMKEWEEASAALEASGS